MATLARALSMHCAVDPDRSVPGNEANVLCSGLDSARSTHGGPAGSVVWGPLTLLGLIAASLLYGDGVITPAISVLRPSTTQLTPRSSDLVDRADGARVEYLPRHSPI